MLAKNSHRSPSGPIAKCQINLNHTGHEVSCPTTLLIGLLIAILIELLVEFPMEFLIWWRS